MASVTRPASTLISDAASLNSHSTSVGLRRYAWLVLAYNIFVILWGAVVRATSSGDGCGKHWPLCNGTILQHHPEAATIIEMAHRMSSGVALLSVLGLLVWTLRGTPRRAIARVTAIASLLLMMNEAFLGALLVMLGYVDKNVSTGRSVVLSLHLANTLLMLAALALTAHFVSTSVTHLRNTARLAGLPLVLVGLGATMIVGITGSLAALGDTLFPAQDLLSAFAQDFAPHTNWLIRVRILHPITAIVAAGFIVWLVFRGLAQRSQNARSLSLGVVCLLVFQIVLGIADVTLLAPVWLQVLHLLGADLLWVTLVILSATLSLAPVATASSSRSVAATA